MIYRVFIYGRKKPGDRYRLEGQSEQIDVWEMSTEKAIREEARKACTSVRWWKKADTGEYMATSASFEIIGDNHEKDEIAEVFPVHAWLYERFSAFING